MGLGSQNMLGGSVGPEISTPDNNRGLVNGRHIKLDNIKNRDVDSSNLLH